MILIISHYDLGDLRSRMFPDCFWNISSVVNGDSLLGAEDRGKGEPVS